jgi:hypothetical protein
VLEVKDWRLDTIASANKSDVELVTPRGVVRETNPFEQARRYSFDVNEQIQRDGRLVHPPGHAYQGKSIVPFGFGVGLINTRKQFAQTDLREVFPEDRCVFKDEMSESADAEAFRERLWRMVATRFGPPLTLPEFDRLRGLLFPEIRIRQIGLPLEVKSSGQQDEILAVMDLHQVQVVRLLAEGPPNNSRRRRFWKDSHPTFYERIFRPEALPPPASGRIARVQHCSGKSAAPDYLGQSWERPRPEPRR